MSAASDLSEIRARLEAATPGPWAWLDRGAFQDSAIRRESTRESIAHDLHPADAEFIARARTDVPRLLEIIQSLQSIALDGHNEPVRDTLGRPIGHFIAVTHESYDGDTTYGIYSSFEEARDDVERRTVAEENREDDDDDHEYSIHNAVVEEWQGSEHVQTYSRDSPFDWGTHR